MLFKRASHTTAFLKMGIMGFQGSGKTYTATDVAIGLVKLLQAKELPQGGRPIFFLDTETGSDWIEPKVRAAGLEMFTAKTRAFVDLATAMREAPGQASVLIIDSITHFWMEFTEAYAKTRKRGRLEFGDWAYLKREWRARFTDPYVNSSLHIIMCGRAGYEYDHFTDEAGKKQIEKSGVKMKAEGELGFEPSILLMMERVQDLDTMRVDHVCTVMKDRRCDARSLDGHRFENPSFKTFLPHIEFLNLGGAQLGVDTTRTSEADIPPETFDRRRVDREIAIDLIKDLGTKHFGATNDDKTKKIELLEDAFGTSSWTAIEKRLSLEDLRAGYDKMHLRLEKKPGRFGTSAAASGDEIPAFLTRGIRPQAAE